MLAETGAQEITVAGVDVSVPIVCCHISNG